LDKTKLPGLAMRLVWRGIRCFWGRGILLERIVGLPSKAIGCCSKRRKLLSRIVGLPSKAIGCCAKGENLPVRRSR